MLSMEGERFSDTLWYKQLTTKYRRVYEDHAIEGMCILIPQTCSLVTAKITKEDIEHHLLLPGRGEFTTASGRKVILAGEQIIAHTGFPRQIVSKVLSADSITVNVNKDGGLKSMRMYVYFISRPLEGGLHAPTRIDDMDHGAIMKFCAMLRSSPETEVVFTALQESVDRVALELRRRRKGAPIPPVERRLSDACSVAADALLTTTFYADEPRNALPALRKQLMQVLESLVIEPLHDQIYALVAESTEEEVARVRQRLDNGSPDFIKCNVKDVFRCDYSNVAAMFGLLHTAATPLEKLHIIRDAISMMYRNVERHLESLKLDVADYDFGSDDVLTVLLYILHLGHPEHRTYEMPVQLQFIQQFHFAEPDLGSSLGLAFANCSQTLQFFETDVEAVGPDTLRQPLCGAGAIDLPLPASASENTETQCEPPVEPQLGQTEATSADAVAP